MAPGRLETAKVDDNPVQDMAKPQAQEPKQKSRPRRRQRPQPNLPADGEDLELRRAARELGRRGGLVSGRRRRVRRHGSPIPKPSMPSASVQAEEIRRPPALVQAAQVARSEAIRPTGDKRCLAGV